MTTKTQGTNLYAIDPADGSLMDIGCVTGVGGIGSTRNSISIGACLADPKGESSKSPGELVPGTATMNLNIDEDNPQHARLHKMFLDGVVLQWVVGLPGGPRNLDGTPAVVPLIDSNDLFDLPDTRGWIPFEGFLSAFPWEFQTNTVINAAISIELTKAPIFIPRDV